jgi:hypothetical protein
MLGPRYKGYSQDKTWGCGGDISARGWGLPRGVWGALQGLFIFNLVI